MVTYPETVEFIRFIIDKTEEEGHFGLQGSDFVVFYKSGSSSTPQKFDGADIRTAEGVRNGWIEQKGGGIERNITATGFDQVRILDFYSKKQQSNRTEIFDAMTEEISRRVPFIDASWTKSQVAGFAVAQIGKLGDQCKFMLDVLAHDEIATLTKSQLKESELLRKGTFVLGIFTLVLAAATFWMALSTSDLVKLEKEKTSELLIIDGRVKKLEAELKDLHILTESLKAANPVSRKSR